MYPDGWREAPVERPTEALDATTTPGIPQHPATSRPFYRAVIVEPDLAVRSVLEYLLVREGFRTEAHSEARSAVEGFAEPGPALLLVAAGDGGGLHVVESRDAAVTLSEMPTATRASPGDPSGAAGIRAFLRKPFGASDVLRVVRALGGSDGHGRDRTGTT